MGVAGPALQKPSTKHFLLSRLHSLSGIIPLGFFLLEHFFSNATAILGEAAYNKQINLLQKIPFLPLIEIAFIAIPLLFHAIYGIYLSLISKNKSFVYPYKRNLMFFFQRVTGILTLIFIVYHVWSFRLKSIFFGTEINYQTVSTDLLNPWIFIIYVLGVVSTSYHFCNGMHPTGRNLKEERMEVVISDAGIANCGNSQNCVQVCPKEIPLTTALSELNLDANMHAFKKWFRK